MGNKNNSLEHDEQPTEGELAKAFSEACKPYAEDPFGFFTHKPSGSNGHIFGYEMKVEKKKIDWAETEIKVCAPSKTLNRLTIDWNGRKIQIRDNGDGQIKIFANGNLMNVEVDTEPITWSNMNGDPIPQATITLSPMEE